MSLEAKIEALTVAVQQLTAKLSHIGEALPEPAPAKQEDKPAPKAEQASAKTDAPVQQDAPAPNSTSAPAGGSATSPSDVTYDDVVAAFKPFAAKNMNAAVQLLKDFGVKKCPDLKPEQYADFVSKIAAAAAQTAA